MTIFYPIQYVKDTDTIVIPEMLILFILAFWPMFGKDLKNQALTVAEEPYCFKKQHFP